MCRGYARRQTEEWRRARWLGTLLVNINRPAGMPAMTQEEVLQLPGDPPWQPPLTEEEFEATMARLAEFDTLQPAA